MEHLVPSGLSRNPTLGLRFKKIIFVPSAANDRIVVRDGENGPIMFVAEALGTYDILKDDFTESGKYNNAGKLAQPFIDAGELTISVANSAYIIFEL